MGNILDYLAESKDSFEERPFGPVDSLVLSELAYLYFDGFVPGPGGGSVLVEELTGDSQVAAITKSTRVPQEDAHLLRAVAQCPRFNGLRLANYVNIIDRQEQEQFSAVTFFIDGGSYVAYRGTDSYYVAWKEDFNLAFICPVPSQISGAEYLDWAASVTQGPIRVGGHSKGGNIAVYSALFCSADTKERILTVYSHDGPGFTQGVLDSPEFAGMSSRLEKTVPQSSLVGILLQHQENYRVIKSESFGIMQHDPYNWVVENKDFCYMESLSSSSLFLDKSLNQWISSLSREELEKFADALYKVLCALPGDTFTDLPDKWWETVRETMNGLKELDSDTYSCIAHTIGSLFSLALKNLPKPKISFTLPDIHLPEMPKPKLPSITQAPIPESLLKKLGLIKSPDEKSC